MQALRSSLFVNSKLSEVLSLKPGVGRNIALHASPAARNSTVLMSTFPLYSTSFIANLVSSFSMKWHISRQRVVHLLVVL